MNNKRIKESLADTQLKDQNYTIRETIINDQKNSTLKSSPSKHEHHNGSSQSNRNLVDNHSVHSSLNMDLAHIEDNN